MDSYEKGREPRTRNAILRLAGSALLSVGAITNEYTADDPTAAPDSFQGIFHGFGAALFGMLIALTVAVVLGLLFPGRRWK